MRSARVPSIRRGRSHIRMSKSCSSLKSIHSSPSGRRLMRRQVGYRLQAGYRVQVIGYRETRAAHGVRGRTGMLSVLKPATLGVAAVMCMSMLITAQQAQERDRAKVPDKYKWDLADI